MHWQQPARRIELRPGCSYECRKARACLRRAMGSRNSAGRAKERGHDIVYDAGVPDGKPRRLGTQCLRCGTARCDELQSRNIGLCDGVLISREHKEGQHIGRCDADPPNRRDGIDEVRYGLLLHGEQEQLLFDAIILRHREPRAEAFGCSLQEGRSGEHTIARHGALESAGDRQVQNPLEQRGGERIGPVSG